VEQLWKHGEKGPRWLIRSPTSTSTPSTRCSTVRRGSTSWWPRRPPTASRRSASPITATCTGSSTSTGRARPRGQAHPRHRGLHGPRPPHRAHRGPREDGRLRRRGRGRQEALVPPHPAGRERGRLQEPDPARLPVVHGGLLPQAQGRLGAARGAQRGPHRHHRLPRRPRAPGHGPQGDHGPRQAADRPAVRGRALRQRGQAGRPPPGHLRARQPLRRAPGPRHPGPAVVQPPPRRSWPRPSGRRCSPPTTATTSTAKTRSATTPCSASRRTPSSATRTASSSTATTTT
jgi:hypothetical protein